MEKDLFGLFLRNENSIDDFSFSFLDQRYSLEIILISLLQVNRVVVNREINEASGITGGNMRVPRFFHVIADALVG